MSAALEPATPPGDQPLDVWVLMPTLVRGGVERVVLRLLAGLDRQRYAPRLLLFADDGSGYPQPADLPVEVFRSNSLRAHIPELARKMRRRPPDVLVVHTSGASVVALLARRLARGRFPVIAVLHIPVGIEHERQRDTIMRVVSKLTLPWAEAVVAVSNGAAANLAAFLGWSLARIRVLDNVVIDDTVLRDAGEPVEHPWFAPGLRVVLGIGRLTPQKDFPTLLQAFALLAADDPSLRLLILGEGPDQLALEGLVEHLGLAEVVAMAGAVPNPFAYMSRSSVFVLSSAWEALPTVLIEALAVGIPVVATDCVAGPREILLDGQLGQLVPVGDAAALAAAVRATLDRPPAADLQLRAQTYGRLAVNGYESLIDEVVAGRRRTT